MAQLQSTAVTGSLTTTGNVGVGTVAAPFKQTIYDSAAAATVYQTSGTGAGTGNGFYVGHTGNISYVWNYNNFPLAIGTNSTERIRIIGDGNVGIGLTNPGNKLHVSGSARINGTIYSGDGSISTSNSLQLQYSAASGDGVLSALSTGGSTTLALQTANSGTTSTKLFIKSDGNVGINNTSPTFKLDVAGGDDTNSFRVYGNSTFGPSVRIHFTGTGGKAWNLISNSASNSGGLGALQFWNSTDTITAMVILPAGNVGIGTDTPAHQLDVTTASQHIARFTSTAANNGGLIINKSNASYNPNILLQAGGTTKWFILSNSGDGDKFQLYDSSGSTPKFTLTQDGNVGIGTGSPARKLDVYENSTVQVVAQFANSSSVSSRIKFADLNTGAENVNIGAIGTRMAMWTNNTERMSILSGGNVGIGITNPSNILHLYTNFAATSSAGTAITLTSDGAGGDQGWIGVNKGTGGGLTLGIENRDIIFQTDNTTAFNGAERMRIDTNGNVGIGTNNPSSGYKLDVRGSILSQVASGNTSVVVATNNANGAVNAIAGSGLEIATDSTNQNIAFRTGASTRMYIKSDGNVGIGTVSPLTQLHVNYTSGTGLTLSNTTANLYAEMRFQSANSSAYIFKSSTGYTSYGGANALNIYNEGQISFSSDTTTNILYLAANGNVGIGTVNPLTKLHVVGNALISTGITAGDSKFYNSVQLTDSLGGNTESWIWAGAADSLYMGVGTVSAGNTKMVINSSGNVGIGITTPTAKLHTGPENWASDPGGKNYSGVAINTSGSDIATGRVFFQGYNLGATDVIGFNNETSRMVLYNYTDTQYLQLWDHSGNIYMATAAGNVGIGTTNAGAKLNVITDTTSQDQVAIFQGTGNLGAGVHLKASGTGGNTWRLLSTGASSTPGADRFGIYSDSAGLYRLVIDDNGRVGIGVTNPAYRLEINGNIYGTTTAQFGNSYIVGNQSGWAIFGSNSTANGIKIVLDGNVARNDLVVATSGNVGIGSSAPAYKLDVTDAARVDGVRLGRDFSIANRATVRLDSNGNAPADVLFGQTAAANQTSWDGVYWSISSRDSGAGASQGQKFTIWRGAEHSAPNNSENQFISITPDLNMGISTTSPAYKLDVAGTGRYTDVLRLDHVGTAHGDGALYIAGVNTYFDWNNGLVFRGTGTSYSARFTGTSEMSAAGQILGVYKEETSPGTVGAVIATFNNDGNVGVGVETPSYRLDVAGDTNNNSFRVYSSNAAGPAVAIQNTSTGGKNWQLISNGSSNADGAGRLQFWQSTDSFTALTVGFNGGEDTNIYTPVHIDSTATTYPLRVDAASLDYALSVSASGNVAVGGLVPAAQLNHKFVVWSGSVALRGPNEAAYSYRLNDTAGTNRNALYVSSSNYLNVGNIAYAGIELFHTGSFDTRYQPTIGFEETRIYGSIEDNYLLGVPNKWLAVRVGGANFVLPMYQV